MQEIGNRSLIARTILECLKVPSIQNVYVSTDSNEIAEESINLGATVLKRSPKLARDETSSEESLAEAISQIQASNMPISEIILFAQCTSPFIDKSELQSAYEQYEIEPKGTLFSAVRSHEFHWELQGNIAVPVSEGALPRKRRQDLKPRFSETGAFYFFNLSEFLKTNNRFNHPVRIFESSKLTSIEIDSYEDLEIARKLSALKNNFEYGTTIKAVVTDFDGVLTDNHLYLNQDGIESVKVSRGDGLGIKLLQESGIQVLILSSEKNLVVQMRASKLNVGCIQGSLDKASALEEWSNKSGIELNEICYVGNDLNDLSTMKIVGFPVAVADSAAEILQTSKIVLNSSGGEHAIRELAEIILKGQNRALGE